MDSLLQLAASLEAGSPRRVTGDVARGDVTGVLHALVDQLAEATGTTRREAMIELTCRLHEDGAALTMDYIRRVLDR